MGRPITLRDPASHGPHASTSSSSSSVTADASTSSASTMDLDATHPRSAGGTPPSADGHHLRTTDDAGPAATPAQPPQATRGLPLSDFLANSTLATTQDERRDRVAEGWLPRRPSQHHSTTRPFPGRHGGSGVIQDLDPLPPILLPPSESDDDTPSVRLRIRSPARRHHVRAPPMEHDVVAEIPADAATTRVRRVARHTNQTTSPDEDGVGRSERLLRLRERARRLPMLAEQTSGAADPVHRTGWQADGTMTSRLGTTVTLHPLSRTEDLENELGVMNSAHLHLRQASAPSLLVTARRVADELERIATDLQGEEVSRALEPTLINAAAVLRELESYARPPSSRTHVWSRSQAARASANDISFETSSNSPRLPHLRRRATDRSGLRGNNETARTTSESDAPDAQTVRYRIAVLSHQEPEGRAGLVLGSESRYATTATQTITPTEEGDANHPAAGSRDWDMSNNHDGQRNSSEGVHTGSLTTAEARHRQRGYHREDANGDPIDSDNEDAFVPRGGGSGALQRLWRQIETQMPAVDRAHDAAMGKTTTRGFPRTDSARHTQSNATGWVGR